MKTKEEIRHNPFFVIVNTQRHVNNWILYVDFELTDQKDDLFLFEPGKGMCIGQGHRYHRYDEDGRHFFNDLMGNFGRVWVLIPGETKPIEFNNYEEFLDEITRD